MKAIVCITTDGSIGRNGDQIYYIKEDLIRFKKLTEGSTVFMGLNTFYALPKKPLLNRKNIILSNTLEAGMYKWTGEVLEKFREGDIKVCNDISEIPQDSWCIGGGMCYETSLPYISEIYITEVQEPGKEGDVKFPNLSLKDWNIYDTSEILTDQTTGTRYKYRLAVRH